MGGIVMEPRVFMSHTKLDKDFCNRFDNAVARVGIRAFRSEFETIEAPAWKTIKEQMEASCAMFLLVGKKLVQAQALSGVSKEARDEWKHTQNWIAYEVGLACQKGIDVWVMCDSVEINFPVPYLNNYSIWGLGGKKVEFLRGVLENYRKGTYYPIGTWGRNMSCPHSECGAKFNLHSVIQKEGEIICPTCLKTMVLPEGHLLEEETS